MSCEPMLGGLEMETAGYAGLFLAAFVAASLLPAQSELLLFAMLQSGRFEPVLLLLVASAGNVLGSALNWGIGRYLSQHRDARWFLVSASAMERAEGWYGRYGWPSLLLSWLPIVGDPLTLVAGLLRTPFPLFLLVVTVAKAGRYAALLFLHAQLVT